MRIVFMGTPQFAAIVLERLVQDCQVVGVFTQPDAIRSRGKRLEPSPVKRVASTHGIPVFEYATFKDNDAFEQLEALQPDVVCVAAYGVLLPKAVIDLPRYGCLNVHGSLLPRWRGAAPIERAILAGDQEVGVCIMQMEEGLDTGAYCMTRAVDTDQLSAPELTIMLAQLGAEALVSAIDLLESDSLAWIDQDEAHVTYANKIDKGELDLDPSLGVEEAIRRVRVSSENHPSKCAIGSKQVTIVSASTVEEAPEQLQGIQAGQVVFVAKRLYLGFENGALEVCEVHPSGKKRMDAKDFAAGLQGVKRGEVSWCGHEQ